MHMLADVVHNLPGILGTGRISARSGPDGWPGPGTFTFYWLWTTASPAQKNWLIEQLQNLEYDYTYLDRYGEWPVYTEPPTSLSLRPGGWRRPYDATSVRIVPTETLANLLTEEFARGLTSKRSDRLIAHLKPGATHTVIPNQPDDIFFGPRRQGIWEYRVLQQMEDGALIDGHLRAFRTTIAELPPSAAKLKRLYLAALPLGHARDTGLWFRDHQSADPNCPRCAAHPQRPIPLADI